MSDEETGGGKGKGKEELAAECSVCGQPAAAHLHYGAVSCYSCRAFFRRGQPKQVRCIFGHGQCKVSKHNRTNCKLCRYRRCLEVGMKPEKVDYYLNKRKAREAERRKRSGEGQDEDETPGSQESAEQAPNRSPASEQKMRSRPGQDQRRQSLSPNQPQSSSSPPMSRGYNLSPAHPRPVLSGQRLSPGHGSTLSPVQQTEVKRESPLYSPHHVSAFTHPVSRYPGHSHHDHHRPMFEPLYPTLLAPVSPVPQYPAPGQWPGLWSSSSSGHQTSVIRSSRSMGDHSGVKQEQSSSDEDTPQHLSQIMSRYSQSPGSNNIIRNSYESQEERPQLFQPYTSVIKRNLDIPAAKPILHSVVNFRQTSLPEPDQHQDWSPSLFINNESETKENSPEESILDVIKSEDVIDDLLNLHQPKMEMSSSPEEDSILCESYKILLSKRSNSSGSESSSGAAINELLSPVPLKKRPRMMEFPYATGHAINKQVQPVLAFTFEEEFKVMEYIVRIEHYQNKRFDYVLSQVPHYMMVLSKMVQCVGMNMKIPFNPEAERMLLSIGLEFTKQSCVDIYDEMAALTTDVRREILNSTYPALYLVMFSIMEGNTREKSWIDQQMKTVHVTKENHKMLSDLVKDCSHVRPVGLKDQEKFSSPWAVNAEDEEKFERTVSIIGRLLRDDMHLQALYHMLVMLTPSSRNSPQIQENPLLLRVRREVSNLMYRYLSSDCNINYSKTQAGSDSINSVLVRAESSPIMKLSEGVEDYSAAEKTDLLIRLVEDIHDCVDIMENRSLKPATNNI